jgi:hypothetical protein
MRWIFGHFENQPTFQQFYRVIIGENASLDYGMILLDAQAPNQIVRNCCDTFDGRHNCMGELIIVLFYCLFNEPLSSRRTRTKKEEEEEEGNFIIYLLCGEHAPCNESSKT